MTWANFCFRSAEIDFGFKYKSLEESLKEQFEQYFALPV